MITFHTLKRLNDLLQISGQAVAGFDLPQLSDYPTLVLDSLLENNLIRRELEGYDHSVLQDVDDHTGELNEGQRAIYDLVLGALHNPQRGEKLFFIDGPGGTDPTQTGRKIGVLDSQTVQVKEVVSRDQSDHLGRTPMTHRHAFEAVDRSLRDVLNNDEDPFGGKTVVLSGDFRQILPVVMRGTPAETIDACLKSSHLWSRFRQVHLTENMRVRAAHSAETAAELAAFSEFLLSWRGKTRGKPAARGDYMKLPRSMLIDDEPEEEVDEEEVVAPGAIPSGLKRLIDVMYPDVNNQAIATDEYFANRTILPTTNVMVRRINDAVASRLGGDAHEYRSIDKLQDDDDWNFFEPEILNSVNINGIPPHKLTLKKGAPIMRMRNLNPDLRLCNGTRLRVVELKPNVIYAKIMTGDRRGQDVLIPRIVFICDGNDASFPYQLRHKQFPFQTAFAVTTNKAQGQTVHNLGLYLASPCFYHGQLYVALSQVTVPSKIKAVIESQSWKKRRSCGIKGDLVPTFSGVAGELQWVPRHGHVVETPLWCADARQIAPNLQYYAFAKPPGLITWGGGIWVLHLSTVLTATFSKVGNFPFYDDNKDCSWNPPPM
ncbi:unnamed protein product [Phytophthora fragariaefolia]|uniref:ATP-dependent DNA helicase n=1 Tax=Phytophthora fragariaefolia TaxID=1490495 RepID=A0A9W6XLS4_9STRA|nr:unnamed protein product [Phytophthora fragariaefolia]